MKQHLTKYTYCTWILSSFALTIGHYWDDGIWFIGYLILAQLAIILNLAFMD